jgi:hypothetical protein
MTWWMWLAFLWGCFALTVTGLLIITAAVGWVAARLWGELPDNNAHKRA